MLRSLFRVINIFIIMLWACFIFFSWSTLRKTKQIKSLGRQIIALQKYFRKWPPQPGIEPKMFYVIILFN